MGSVTRVSMSVGDRDGVSSHSAYIGSGVHRDFVLCAPGGFCLGLGDTMTIISHLRLVWNHIFTRHSHTWCDF